MKYFDGFVNYFFRKGISYSTIYTVGCTLAQMYGSARDGFSRKPKGIATWKKVFARVTGVFSCEGRVILHPCSIMVTNYTNDVYLFRIRLSLSVQFAPGA